MSSHDTSKTRRRFLAQSAQIALGSAAAWARASSIITPGITGRCGK